jgi:hypothetical protein
MILNFKNYINESRLPDVRFGSWNSYGYVTVYINGEKYVYLTDTINIRGILKKARYKPLSALNDLKSVSELVEKPIK